MHTQVKKVRDVPPLTRPRVAYLIRRQCELLKVLLKEICEGFRLQVIRIRIYPGITREKQFCRHARTSRRHTQTEDGLRHKIGSVDLPTDCRTHHCPRIVNIDTRPSSIRTTSPACIDQVTAYLMLLDTLT